MIWFLKQIPSSGWNIEAIEGQKSICLFFPDNPKPNPVCPAGSPAGYPKYSRRLSPQPTKKPENHRSFPAQRLL